MNEDVQVTSKNKDKTHTVKLSNVVLLIIVAFFTAFTSSFYDNWSSFTTLLLRGNVYSNYCSAEQLKSNSAISGKCEKQYFKVSQLLSIFRFAHYLSAAVFGAILDRYGNFVTYTIGMSCAFFSWLLFGLYSHSNAFVVLSCVLMAMSVDSTAFSALMIKYKFKNYESLVMSVIGSASSISSVIPVFLNFHIEYTKSTFKAASILFAFLVIGIAWIIMSIVHMKFVKNVTTEDVKCSLSDNIPLNVTLLECLKSVEFLCISFFFIVTNLTLTYHQFFLNIQYSNTSLVSRVMEMFFIFSAVPCIILGYVIDKRGIRLVLPILNLFGLITPIFSLYTNTVNGIIMAFCMMIIYSLFATAVFCYVQDVFPAYNFGKICGIVSIIGGLSSMACMPLFELCHTHGIDFYVNIFMILLRLGTFVPLWCIYKRKDAIKMV